MKQTILVIILLVLVSFMIYSIYPKVFDSESGSKSGSKFDSESKFKSENERLLESNRDLKIRFDSLQTEINKRDLEIDLLSKQIDSSNKKIINIDVKESNKINIINNYTIYDQYEYFTEHFK